MSRSFSGSPSTMALAIVLATSPVGLARRSAVSFGEILFEALHRRSDDLRHLLGRHLRKAGLVQVLVLSAEHLLGEEQHALLVFFRHAEDLHDDMQRIGRGDGAHEVHLALAGQKAIDSAVGDPAHLVFEAAQVLGHEPFLRQLAIGHVDRRIESDEAGDQMLAAAAELLGKRDAVRQRENDAARIVEESRIVLRHAHHVVIARDQPEGRMFAVGRFDPGDGRFGAHMVEGVENAVPIRIGCRIDDGARGGRDRCAVISWPPRPPPHAAHIRRAARACRACR